MSDVREIVAKRLLEEIERQADDPSRGFTGYVHVNSMRDVCIDIQSVDLIALANIAILAGVAVTEAAALTNPKNERT